MLHMYPNSTQNPSELVDFFGEEPTRKVECSDPYVPENLIGGGGISSIYYVAPGKVEKLTPIVPLTDEPTPTYDVEVELSRNVIKTEGKTFPLSYNQQKHLRAAVVEHHLLSHLTGLNLFPQVDGAQRFMVMEGELQAVTIMNYVAGESLLSYGTRGFLYLTSPLP